MSHSFRRGQSIVEMLIATSVIVVSVLGIIVLVNRALGLNRLSSEEYTATYLAAEGIELVQNLFDRSYLLTATDPSFAGTNALYGWVGSYALPGEGVYEMDYSETQLNETSVSSCTLSGQVTEERVRQLLTSSSCSPRTLNLDAAGFYSYAPGGTPTKFRRLIILQPSPIAGETGKEIDYRVISAVGWESKGGEFVVHLEHHLLPWRTL